MSLDAPTPLRRVSRAPMPDPRRAASLAVAGADEPAARAARARAAWRRLGLRIVAVTPSQLAAGLLVVGGLAGLAWLVLSAWSALLPLQLGLVLAYATLPVVNWLERRMPRSLAAGLVMLA